MPVISFVSPKGGVGKTTAVVTLACQLAQGGAQVRVIDADPNRPIAAWARLPGRPDNLVVIEDAEQNNIIDRIDEAAAEAPFVLVDCEGSASLTVANAIGSADLVIVPTQASQLDALQGGRALKLIKDQERIARRGIPHRVLFTRTSPAIRTKNLAAIQQQLADAGIPQLQTHLHEREAFKAVFSFGGPLELLEPGQVSSPDKAIANARALTSEVLDVLRQEGLAK